MPERPRGGFGGNPGGGGYRPQPAMNAAPATAAPPAMPAPPAMMAPPPRMERPPEARSEAPPPPRNQGQVERQARGADMKRERPQ
jgi:hypothetical protein